MQIQRIHDDQHRYSPPTGPHTQPKAMNNGEPVARSRRDETLVFMPSQGPASDISDLIEKLRELPDLDDEAIQAATESFQSGRLITREVAKLVATSSLREFVF